MIRTIGSGVISCRVRRLSGFGALAAAVALCGLPLAGQLPSAASLKGAYFVRYLGLYNDSSTLCSNNPCRALFEGTMTFDGAGNFQLAGQGITPDSGSNQSPLIFANSGKYYVSSSGWLEFYSPFDPSGKDLLQGGMGPGGNSIVASSAAWGYYDLLVGIPVSTAASNSILSGNYHVASLGFWSAPDRVLGSDTFGSQSTFFSLTADGKGGLGTVTVKGSQSGSGNGPAVQTSAGASYAVKIDGSGMLSLPPPVGVAPQHQLLAGDKLLYVSPDGSLFIAGGSSAYELVLGIKAFSGSAPNDSLQGIYFRSNFDSETNGTTTSTGAVNEIPSLNLEVGDEWDLSTQWGAYDFTYQQGFAFSADGTRSSGDNNWAVGVGGQYVIGAATGSDAFSISLRVKAPAMSGSGVFLNPQGVVNAANNAPFSSSLAPGELISLYGSGLAGQTASASSAPWPTVLGGVQVLIGGTPAPLSFVSPTQISAVVPFAVPTYTCQFVEVVNNAVTSNSFCVNVRNTSPGLFTVPSGGIGNGAILHSTDYSLVSPSNPARVGETVILFLTGLGAVQPAIADGTSGPSNPPSTITDKGLAIYIDGTQAKSLFAGLAPGLVGLYQINVTIPEGVSGPEAGIEIDTSDGTTTMPTIPIAQ